MPSRAAERLALDDDTKTVGTGFSEHESTCAAIGHGNIFVLQKCCFQRVNNVCLYMSLREIYDKERREDRLQSGMELGEESPRNFKKNVCLTREIPECGLFASPSLSNIDVHNSRWRRLFSAVKC